MVGLARTSFWLAAASIIVLTPRAHAADFINFESGPVRPLALSSDGTRLYAVNTPDNRLEVFEVNAAGLSPLYDVPVGMEPVAVAARDNGDVWVVNHLSDSVSIVDTATRRVKRTLLVGDEPRDIVFAGVGFSRAFITTAHRGQQRTHASIAGVTGSGDPQLTTEGVPRADVWVFNANNPGGGVGGVPVRIVQLFGDTPRALAASPDGTTVYAAVLHSGNRSVALNSNFVCESFDPFTPCQIAPAVQAPGGVPPPATNVEGEQAPHVGLLLEFDPTDATWRDILDRNWTLFVRFNLPDTDVFAINASTLLQTASFAGVGTTLFNMVAHPTSGRLYVSNTDSRNDTRFEGPGVVGGSTVQGHLAEARITVIDGANALPRHLNKHIDYDTLAGEPGFDPTARNHSLATPLGMTISGDGTTLYVAAFGSGKVGVYPTAQLDADTFDPTVASASHIDVSGGGPSGLALDEPRGRLYVSTRFDSGISIVDLASGKEIDHLAYFSPEPAAVVDGRPFLYDAFDTSANGEASCASCHTFGDMDQLTWDLGNPDDVVTTNPIPILNSAAAILFPDINGTGNVDDFHPMKGPMATQTLRGLPTHGAMHWRGDRANGFFGVDAFDEDLSFNNFIVAFEGLLGRATAISASDMQKFTDFALTMTLPPNPVRALDDSLTAAQASGRSFFLNTVVDGPRRCVDCHNLSPSLGHFGTSGNSSFEGSAQIVKVPHLRNLYQKVGMFGLLAPNGGGIAHLGDQVRGTGFSHDGSVDTLFRFVSGAVFNFPNDTARRNMEQFMLAFDSDLPPMVGQQVTRSGTNGVDVDPRINAMIAAAAAPYASLILGPGATQCDLVVKGVVSGLARGYLLDAGSFVSDRANEPPLSDAQLRALTSTAGQELTYTCAPFGSGKRMALDRDGDTFFDRDEIDAGSDPADPGSLPPSTVQPVAAKKLLIKNKLPDDESRNKVVLLARDPAISIPPPLSSRDPRCNGAPAGTVKATLTVSSVSSGESHAAPLPCEHWKILGNDANPLGYKYSDGDLVSSTARAVTWKAGSQLKAVLKGSGPSNLDYDLQVAVPQGTVAATLASGTDRLCIVCSGSNGKDGSDGKRFLGKSCAAPVACP